MLLLRRLLFVSLLILLSHIPSRYLLGIMIFIQLFYGAYIALSRPYKETKCNLVEIINEAYFFLFLITFIIFNLQNEWNTVKTNIYVWILASNSMIVFLIILIYSIKILINWIKDK